MFVTYQTTNLESLATCVTGDTVWDKKRLEQELTTSNQSHYNPTHLINIISSILSKFIRIKMA